MKIASNQEVKEYTNAIYTGFAKGCAVGAVVALGLYQVVKRKQFFTTMTATTKTFFALSIPVGFGMTNLEWVSLDFDMHQYGFGEGSEAALEEQKKIENMTSGQKIVYYASENKYKLIAGAWAASMGGSFWWVNRDKYMTKAQKIVQARMYAQSITIVLLLASMLLSVNGPREKKNPLDLEYSWEAIAAKEEAREKAAGLPTRIPAKTSEQ
ncbi:uncharacterized protein SAPINGB_P005734 [Magnusiomyces paraingens]|uniref:HIG1 domain-containing protein n=1 Tax=Magnusiomyces paraingens TaxID=2606893 RepID=A0A5E8C3I3_9ASCO|nr:uncharacterized protein SAPINGB_P005734 [Saprochaete ingens]VVT57515.1 unnamed protein product [Saprochaete ingens]